MFTALITPSNTTAVTPAALVSALLSDTDLYDNNDDIY
jgi:hypothetical protein